MNFKLVLLVTAWCLVDAAILAAEEEKKKSDIPTVTLPYSPIFPFRTSKPITELDELSAKAKPGATFECDLKRAPFSAGQGFGTYPEIKRGTITLHTEKGYVEMSSSGVKIKPSAEKAVKTFPSTRAGYDLDFFRSRKGGVICIVNVGRVVVEDADYRDLRLPVREENEKWRANLKVSLSADFDGSFKWFVSCDGK